MESVFDFIRRLAGEINNPFHIEDVKIFFKAPNPKKPSSKSLTPDPSGGNFQWVDYQVLFKKVGEEEDAESKYYIYDLPLNDDGSEKGPDFIFDSDSDWNAEKITNKIPTKDGITTGDIKRNFPKILRGPNLYPDKYAQVIYVNTDASDKGRTYSSEEFKKFFDSDFYVVFNPTNKEMKNPFGKFIGLKGEKE